MLRAEEQLARGLPQHPSVESAGKVCCTQQQVPELTVDSIAIDYPGTVSDTKPGLRTREPGLKVRASDVEHQYKSFRI